MAGQHQWWRKQNSFQLPFFCVCSANELHPGKSWENPVRVKLKLEFRKEITKDSLARYLKEIHISSSEKAEY